MKRLIFSLTGILILFLNCTSSEKQFSMIDDPDYLIGEWVFVRYVYSPVGRYVQKQYEEIIASNLIITKDSIYFKEKIDFIESCGNFKWNFSTPDKFMSKDLKNIGEYQLDKLIEINTNCYEDITPSFLKADTLISFNGGIVTYRVKVAKTGN